MTADLSVVAEMRQHALEESWALRTEVRLDRLDSYVPLPGWREHKACHNSTSVFYPEGKGISYKAARAICSTCPVPLSCLAQHLDDEYGCYGGTSPRQRKDIRAALNARRAA